MRPFESEDYRQILLKTVQQMPKKGHGQFRKLALHLGVNSVVISQIVAGKRDFTPEQACAVAEYFSFSKLEQDYFLLLVQRERAGTARLKGVLTEHIEKIRKEAGKLSQRISATTELSDQAKTIFYSSWIYSGIQMASSLKGGITPQEIAETLGLSIGKVAKVTEFLLEHELCIKEGNRLRAGPTLTHLDITSPLVKSHLQNWRVKAFENMDEKGENELYYSCPMVISKTDVKKVRELLLQALENITTLLGPSEPETLVCLNMDWFNF